MKLSLSEHQTTITELRAECFPLDLSEVESAVVLHKLDDGVKLLIYKDAVIRYHSSSDNRRGLAVLMVNLGNGDVESAF